MVMMVVMVVALGLANLLHGRIRLLRRGQIARLQRLSQSGELLPYGRDRRGGGRGTGARGGSRRGGRSGARSGGAAAAAGQFGEILLGSGKIARLQRLPELLEFSPPLLKAVLDLAGLKETGTHDSRYRHVSPP